MPELIVGRQPVLEALKAKQPIEKILLLHGTQGDVISSIYKLAKQSGIPVTQSTRDRFRELAADQSAQGVIALVAATAYVEIDDLLAVAAGKQEPPFLLILDEIEDVHNLGALLRTAECAGVHGVIIPKHHAASINATVMKTSAGAAAHVPVARVSNIVQSLEELKRNGLWIIGLDMDGKTDLFASRISGAVGLVVGSEGKGMRRLVKETCDELLRIPMFGQIGSLNASVSGALAMYEVARKRRVTQ